MGTKYHRYHGSVFAHKKGNWFGMDQGKGLLHRGDTVEMTLNLLVDNNVLSNREGQDRTLTFALGIDSAEETQSGISIGSGTNLFFGTSVPAYLI